MTDLLITTYEAIRVERSTPTTSKPVKVRFSFHLGYDVFLSVKAEVTEETNADGFTTSHDVTILECVHHSGDWMFTDVKIYSKGMEALRAAIEEKAVECSHNKKYHVK